MRSGPKKVRKLKEHIGAEVVGVDLAKPIDAETRRHLNEALAQNVVLAIKNQVLDARQFLAAGSQFGEPIAPGDSARLPDVPLVQRVSSHTRHKDGSVYRTGPRWHTDQADHEHPPKYTALYAVELFRTGGGTTGFVNMRAAYDSLPEHLRKQIDGMQTFYVSSRKASRTGGVDQLRGPAPEPAPVIHPLVRTNPDTGRKAIYFHPDRVDGIVGMTQESSGRLLGELLERALVPEYVYDHDWALGDLLIWDNRSALHKANYDYDPTDMTQHRCLYRMLVSGERPR